MEIQFENRNILIFFRKKKNQRIEGRHHTPLQDIKICNLHLQSKASND